MARAGFLHREATSYWCARGPFDDSGSAATAHVKLIDFGNAVTIADAALPRNRHCWVRAYTSDARLAAGGIATPADDVFAVSVLGVELLLGQSISSIARSATGDAAAAERAANGGRSPNRSHVAIPGIASGRWKPADFGSF
uniref:Protein kinase domain-containing protein n=1 Tax=Neobodo designis TaxID=312471 RepID=A0A7S1MLW2_NEODS|mmetsp:Transcript_43063/g.133076  ORF Transcript_43063/g.133076 Transcript_43063/m.133076 type:complete len:141 (+) Transcript_43063:313-735(+)